MKNPFPQKFWATSPLIRGLQGLFNHTSMDFGEGHRPVNFPISSFFRKVKGGYAGSFYRKSYHRDALEFLNELLLCRGCWLLLLSCHQLFERSDLRRKHRRRRRRRRIISSPWNHGLNNDGGKP